MCSLKKRLCLCLIAALPGCKDEPERKTAVRPVRAVKICDLEGFTGRAFPGRARAVQEVNLSFRVSGPLILLHANVGDEVAKGDVLAQIDPRDYEVQVRNAEGQLARVAANLQAMKVGARPEDLEKLRADVREAEAAMARWQEEYDRIKELEAKGAAQPIEIARTTESRNSAEATLQRAKENLRIGETGARPEDIEATEAEIESLEAAVAAAKDAVEYTKLRAPFNGSIAAVYVENFQTVQAKERIVRLLDTSRIEMTVGIPEHLISGAQYVKEAVVTFDAFPEEQIEATIKEIGTEASATTRTYPVTLIMKQPKNVKILPGMSGSARGRGKLPAHISDRGLEVPETAVFTHDSGETSVWVIDEGTSSVKRVTVTTGDLTPLGIRVKGLEPGLWVATAGVHFLSEGQKVRILDDSVGG